MLDEGEVEVGDEDTGGSRDGGRGISGIKRKCGG